MNGVLKTALVVGAAVAVETLLLQRLSADLPWGAGLGMFLVASVLLIALQHAVSKHYSMRARRRRRQPPKEPAPVTWSGLDPHLSEEHHDVQKEEPAPVTGNGLDPSSVPTTPNAAGASHNSAPRREQKANTALPGEDGIINEENS